MLEDNWFSKDSKYFFPEPTALKNSIENRIAIIERGDCTFIEKARAAQKGGALAVIIIDNTANTSSDNQPMFAMSGDGKDDVTVPVVFLFSADGAILKKALQDNPDLEVSFAWSFLNSFFKNPNSIIYFADKHNANDGLRQEIGERT